jgi:hypothetical protein
LSRADIILPFTAAAATSSTSSISLISTTGVSTSISAIQGNAATSSTSSAFSTSSQDSQGSSSSGGLATSDKIGLGVGVPAAVISLAGVLIAWIYRRKPKTGDALQMSEQE